MFKLNLYIKTKNGEKFVKTIQRNIRTMEEADKLCDQKNKDLKADLDNVGLGRKFALFDCQ